MIKLTPTHSEELENTQNSAEETPKQVSTKIIEREHVEKTPFWIIKLEKGWFIAMTDKRLTDFYKTKEEVLELIYTKDWELLFNMTIHLAKHIIYEQKELKF